MKCISQSNGVEKKERARCEVEMLIKGKWIRAVHVWTDTCKSMNERTIKITLKLY